ncbi:MAG: hydrogenase maturation protease [Acidobacteria bacterium]|nr:hydrogenase maturation protease [Acidobacteriota bacterium]
MKAAASLAGVLSRRPCLVGIGNPDRSDDGVGPRIVAAVRERAAGTVPILDAGDVLENYLFPIAETACRDVVLIDAVAADMEPGTLVFGPLEDFSGVSSGFSHKPSLHLCARILAQSGKRTWLLGIVPRSLDYGAGLTAEIEEAARGMAAAIIAGLAAAEGEDYDGA